jgi:hypothetical protein
MKTVRRLLCVVALFVGVMVSYSYAETTKTKVVVRADEHALITIEQGEGIVRLVQFCPDAWKKGCGNNFVVKRSGNSFQLDKEALADHQTAFNFVFDTGNWLRIPDESNVTLPDNFLKIEEGENGAYFVYVGPVPIQ